jgi:hypothetical protein
MFAVVVGRYNKDEDSLENVSLIKDEVLEYILSGTKVERAYTIEASMYPYFPQIQGIVENIDIDGKMVVFELKKGKTISHCILIPLTQG